MLQVWLPLNGNLDNQGLSDFTFNNSGAVIDNNGKIGKCYSLDGSSSLLYSVHDKTIWNHKPITIAVWFKCDQNRSSGIIVDIAADMTLGYYYNSNGIRFYYWRAWLNGSTRTGDTYADSTYYDATKWHHAVYVADGPMNYIYVDGQLSKYWDSSSKYTDNFIPLLGASYNRITIGTSAGNPNNRANGLVNDIRIYDHALSPREIKEISKGLVLHYPLNRGGFGGDNLLKKPNHNIYHNSNNSSQCPVEREWRIDNGIEYERIKRINTSLNPGSFSNYGLCAKQVIDESVISGMQVTISFWCRCSHDQDRTYAAFTEINTSSSSSGVSGEVTPMKAGQWTKFTVTKTLSFSYNDLSKGARAWDLAVYGHVIPSGETDNYYFDFRQDYKVENGSIATPWTPNSSDFLYSSMGLDENIVYDTSGFQNNGELVVIGKNLIDKNNVTSGGYINNTGGITNTFGWNYTNYIKVKPSTSYIASSISSGGSGTYLALYNVNKTLTRTVLITANQNPTFTTTATERYVRFSIRSLNNELDTAKLEEGTTVTAYGSEGTIEWEANSPRYTLACNPHSSNSTQSARPGTTYIRGDCQLTTPNQMTIAFWCYARNSGYGGYTGQGVFCTTNNTSDAIGLDYQTSAMNHRDSAVDINSSAGNTHIRLSIVFTANEWHHYAFTYDGQNAKSYKDGVLQDTKSFSAETTLGSFSSVVLGLSHAGSVWRRNDNTYSDLRMYATCLSESDIQSLYQIPISLSNNGTLFAGEYVEG